MASADNNTSTKRRFRFRLRSLLVVMVLVSVVLAIVAEPVMERRRQQYLLALARERGAGISDHRSFLHHPSLGRSVLSWFDHSYLQTHLYELDFSGTKITDDDLREIAGLHDVVVLNLSGTQVNDDSMLILQTMPCLVRIDLSGTLVTDEGIAHLGDVETLASLCVTDTRVTYDAMGNLDEDLPSAHLVEEMAIDELTASGIVVSYVGRSVKAFDAARDSHGRFIIAGKEALTVEASKATLSSVQVARFDHLTSLEQLHLVRVSMGPEGLTALTRLPQLTFVGVYSTNLTDADLKSLARQTQLERLEIYECDGITNEGLAQLASLPNLKKLRVWYCRGITQQAYSRLAEALPDCECDFPVGEPAPAGPAE